MHKKGYIVLLGLFGVIVAVAAYFYIDSKKITAYEFAGGVDSVENNIILASGNFVSSDHPEVSQNPQQTKISIDDKTIFTRTIVEIPSSEELKKSNGTFNGADLKRTETSSSLDGFLKDNNDQSNMVSSTIYVKAKSNIYKRDSFRASELKYVIGRQKNEK